MHKKKFSDEQQELVALLPQGLPKLTDGAKLVLANIILWYGTDKAKETGIMYRTNQDMMNDCEIGSENTIIRATKQLEMLGLLSSKRGKRGEASEYVLSNEMLEKINFNPQSEVITPQSAGESAVINPQSEVINQLVEQNKALTLKVNELQSAVITLQSEVKRLIEQSKCSNKSSKCSTDTDTESDKEKEKRNMVHVTEVKDTCTDEVTQADEVTTETVETISAEVTKASAYKHSSSLIEEEKASAHEASASKPISDDEVTRDSNKPISAVENETISADTSTEEVLSSEADVISTSSKDNLSTADRLTYPQPLVKALTPNSAAPLSQEVENFISRVKTTIRKGVFDWSLKLEEVPDYLTGDDINSVVAPALRQQPDVNDYLGQFRLSELHGYTTELMENRLKNKDIPTIVRQNAYNKRHQQYHKELVSA